ncbi:ABC transporter permease [Planctomycetota bacterium]
MKTIWHDMRFGLRQLRKSPGFTAVAVLSLALGIGANTAIFSMINGILYKSLPVRDPHELRVINWTCDPTHNWPMMRDREGGFARSKSNMIYCGSFPYPAYQDFAEQAKGFSDIFAFSHVRSKTINAGGIATLANAQMVSGNFFRSYGAEVLIGRPITPEDDRPDASLVAVLTYPFWQRVFGLDPHIIGRTLTVGNTGFTVIGILPRHHEGPWGGQARIDFYVPMTAQARVAGEDEKLSSDNAWWVQMIGRLAPGADEAQVQASLELLFSHVVNRSETRIDRPGILLQKGRHGVVTGRQRTAGLLWFVLPGVGLVLLIACTNLAGLLLARGAARQHEMAVRAAMGAGRWRLIRQSLTESMILSLAGVCLGLIFSIWIRTALRGYIIDSSNNQHFNLRIDVNVLLFALAAGVVTTLLSGLFPALRAGNTDPSAGLKDSGSRGAPRLRLGKVLVTAQVGLSIIVVVAGGLLCRTLVNLYRTDPGFDTENLLLVPIEPGQSLSPPKDLQGFFYSVRQKIAGIPGVRSVALSNQTLLGGWLRSTGVSIPGRPDAKPCESLELIVSDGYFATMGIDLLNGRDFRAAETRGSQQIAIVNEEFVRLFFPNGNPLGQFILVEGEQHQIVGVCSNHRCWYLRRDISPILYVPHNERNWRGHMTYAIHTVLPPMSLIPAVRKAVADLDRNLPIEGITTQKLLLKKSLRYGRLLASLSGSLAFLGLALSCIGLYGIMAYTVARRTGEVGIRMALGACPWDVAWPILREALILAGIGVAIGLPFALALVRLIRAAFYGLEPHDPLTMVGAAVLMIAVAALAAWIPARRAAKIDPMNALRYE